MFTPNTKPSQKAPASNDGFSNWTATNRDPGDILGYERLPVKICACPTLTQKEDNAKQIPSSPLPWKPTFLGRIVINHRVKNKPPQKKLRKPQVWRSAFTFCRSCMSVDWPCQPDALFEDFILQFKTRTWSG